MSNQEERDEAGMKKAMDLLKAHGPVVDRLTDMGHLKAAKNIEAKGGRWDSPEVRDAHKRDRGGQGR